MTMVILSILLILHTLLFLVGYLSVERSSYQEFTLMSMISSPRTHPKTGYAKLTMLSLSILLFLHRLLFLVGYLSVERSSNQEFILIFTIFFPKTHPKTDYANLTMLSFLFY